MAQKPNFGKASYPFWEEKPAADNSSAPPDPHATEVAVSLVGAKPIWVKADESHAIWNAERQVDGQVISVQGPLARCTPGESLKLIGKYKKHDKHGWSFMANDYVSALPQTGEGIARWLQYRIKGIGPTFAKAIVDHFGAHDVFRILDEDPNKMRVVKTKSGRSIPQKQMDNAIAAWDDVKAIRQVETFLFSHGVTAKRADLLYRTYGGDVIDVLQNDPYRITEIKMIGFKIADQIARNLGFALDDPRRLKAGVTFLLAEAESSGHVFLLLDQLFLLAAEVLYELKVKDGERLDRVQQQKVATVAGELAKDGLIVVESDDVTGQRVYDRKLWMREVRLSQNVRTLLQPTHTPLFSEPKRPVAPEGATPEQVFALKLPTDEQWSAVEMVRTHRLSLLTGGPGVGKCVVGETPILIDGRMVSAEEAWNTYGKDQEAAFDGEGEWKIPNQLLTTAALNEETGEMVASPITKLYRQHVKETLRRVTLDDGSQITMTKRHRLHTANGWSNEFSIGGEVSVTDDTGYELSLSSVTKVEELDFEGYVYDFEVEKHHNYVAANIVTHNTQTQVTLTNIVQAYNKKIRMAAPTGKAARRMTELTGLPATTIHRLLEFSPIDGSFLRDESNPIEADLVIIDESSMLDLRLADSLFRAIGNKTHVLMVGDPDQLPPVGSGRVLADLIDLTGLVTRTHLSKIFRQAGLSMIVRNSARINQGIMPFLSHDEAVSALQEPDMLKDFFWIPRNDPDEMRELIVSMVVDKIPNTFKIDPRTKRMYPAGPASKVEGAIDVDPRTDIMVLAPMHGGRVGLDILNKELEQRLNAGASGTAPKIVLPQKGIRVGSRIVQTKNDYTDGKEVMNGEIAIVKDFDEENQEAYLSFDDGDRELWIPTASMDTYNLAWAMSIHKSQGSEFRCVVMPISTAHFRMLQKALIYTGVTRAKEVCIVIGERKAMAIALKNAEMAKRNSLLGPRILNASLSGTLF
jgi:ATP-dependent exoDNAse (exonuclease V) alpha subunit